MSDQVKRLLHLINTHEWHCSLCGEPLPNIVQAATPYGEVMVNRSYYCPCGGGPEHNELRKVKHDSSPK